jgi:hypothetical protein
MSSKNFSKSCTPNLGGISDLYTKAEINQLLNAKANLSQVYTRTYLDNQFALYATLANTYTKSEVNSLVSAINQNFNNYLRKVPTTLQPNIINPGNNNTVALTIRGSATNLLISEWLNSSGSTVAYIGSNGNATFENKVTIGQLTLAGSVALDVQSRRISGVADPVDDSDAVPYSFLQSYVEGNGQAISILQNHGLVLNSSVLSTAYNTLVADNRLSVPVGGAPATLASTWKTRNIVEVLDAILFPVSPATVGSGKSVNLTVSGDSGTLEIGRTVSRVLTATFGQGQIVNGDGSPGPVLVGAATSYSFTGTGISQTDQPGNTLSVTNTVQSGTNNWAVTAFHGVGTGVYYDSGLVPATNLDSLRVAGSVADTTSSPTVTGVYPYFWGVSSTSLTAAQIAVLVSSGDVAANKVVESSANTLSVTFGASAQYLWFAHPTSSTTKTKWYNTVINNGSIGSPTDLFGASATQAFNSSLSYWSGVSYRVYVSNYATTTGGVMELRNN